VSRGLLEEREECAAIRGGSSQRDSGETLFTKLFALEVEALDIVRRSHGALPITAMPQAQRVPQFVSTFFDEAAPEQGGIRRETVEFFAKTM
jgi:hypothetical protein